MVKAKRKGLARRERQIMDALYRLGQATVAEVQEALPDPRNYSTVRAQLRVLEEKGHVRHEEQGLRYLYFPAVPREVAQQSAIRHMVETFFEGSAAKAVTALLGEDSRLSTAELARLAELIAREKVRKEGKA